MQALTRRLSAGIIILLTTAALAQAQVRVEDTTPCSKVLPERVKVRMIFRWFLEAVRYRHFAASQPSPS